MRISYIFLCLSVLGTSALNICENYCEHKGKCSTEMAAKQLTCDDGTQQRDACDHHGFEADSAEDIKKQCCQVTCYSMFVANKFSCPEGYNTPTKKDSRHQTADRSAGDLQKECCQKPKVSCYTLLQAKKFTCPTTHFKPTKTYKNDDIHEDMTTKTTQELQSRCCGAKSICHSKLSAKNLDCDGFGTMPGMEDTSLDDELTGEADTDDSVLQKQCCRPNCFGAMKEKGFSCPANTLMRGKQDGHKPSDMTKERLENECCQKNCYTRMKAANAVCPKGRVVKDKGDMHDPGDATGDDLINQCCQEVHCGDHNYCFAAMSEKGIGDSCPKNTMTPSTCDGHWPFDDHPSDKMAVIKAKSADEVRSACCRNTCYGTMNSRGLRCQAGYKNRDMSDGHNPFGNGWTTKTDQEIKDGCCQKVNKCFVKLKAHNLDCSGYGVGISEFEEWNGDVDTSQLQTDEEIQNACCRKTCSLVMTQKKLECDRSEQLRCSEHYRPSGWTSFAQSDADLKWACCEPGASRPKFNGCPALFGCSGEECHSKCPGDERMREDGHNPFGETRDFKNMDQAALLDKCCRPTCYDQINRRLSVTCPAGTKGYDKHDMHNPFDWNVDMRKQSKVEILAKCCKPLNKCNTKLKEMNLSCDGFGKFPDETDKTKYDFDPLKLTDAKVAKSKCCQPNCFYTMQTRSLQCKKGIGRSKHDGHNPFPGGFAKQSDDRILDECCSENCYSYLKDNQLTCDAGEVRGKDDFHGVDFKSLGKPEDAKGECCRLGCVDALQSKSLSCGEGYMPRDDKRTNKEWAEYDENRLKGECCKEIPAECRKTANTPKAWVDKRQTSKPAELVTYLDNWGQKVLETKTTGMKYNVIHCKMENKKFGSAEECKAAEENCCFECDKMECGGNMPSASTCANKQPSAFMKKFGITECSTDGSIDLDPMTDCGDCPSARDLFENYDDNTLFGNTMLNSNFAIGKVLKGFHGGINLHNVESDLRIQDKSCPKATAGLLISPRNSGNIEATGKKGTLYAIVDVVNEKGKAKFEGAADYLLVGGSNAADVDFTTTGEVSVVGMDNTGKVSVRSTRHTLVGNTVNSGQVVLKGTGAIVNVANKAGASVTLQKGSDPDTVTKWTLLDVSNDDGASVSIEADEVEFGGPGTRNAGTVTVISGKLSGKVKENTGKIAIQGPVTGKILFCKNSGEIDKNDNDGGFTYVVDPDDPFCAFEAPKPTPKPAAPPAPKLFFCRNSEKHATKLFKTAEEAWSSDSAVYCSDMMKNMKDYFDAFRLDIESPDVKNFYAKCCDPTPNPPKGQKYMLKKKMIKRKRVKAKTTVNLDFTNRDNDNQRKKFEGAFIKRAKAKQGTFAYKKVTQRKRRRLDSSLAQTEVSATLEFDDDATAEAGEAAVTATTFANEVGQDLQNDGVTITLTQPSASIELTDEEVVEQVLVNEDSGDNTAGDTNTGAGGDTNTGAGGDTNTNTGAGGDTKTGAGGDTNTGAGGDTNTGAGGDTNTGAGGATKTEAGGGTTQASDPVLKEDPVLSAAALNQMMTFVIASVTIAVLF